MQGRENGTDSSGGCGRRRAVDDLCPGGDQALVMDFVAMLRGGPTSLCSTAREDSLTGHRLVYLAEDSRLSGACRRNFERCSQ
ncbi:MAG: hypothetical protein PHY12_03165 [Eubacteriales bacterium]|nr:hypothetical protein [Eubacteriales bacterium]